MQRLTNQKQIILEYIKSVHSHPTAEDVYIAVKKKLPRISLGTVYRNLEKFTEDGIILEIKGEIKRFDGDISEHQHFICNDCGKIFDIFEKRIDLKKLIKKINLIGRITRCDFYIYGTCQDCQRQYNLGLTKSNLSKRLFNNFDKSKNIMACKKKKVTTKNSSPRKKQFAKSCCKSKK